MTADMDRALHLQAQALLLHTGAQPTTLLQKLVDAVRKCHWSWVSHAHAHACSPQMAMDPMPLTDNLPLVRDHAAEFHGVSGWPAQPKLVPTVIVCKHRGSMRVPISPQMLCAWSFLSCMPRRPDVPASLRVDYSSQGMLLSVMPCSTHHQLSRHLVRREPWWGACGGRGILR